MEKNNMKNIVVIKNLPSNLVDEAIVILKSNKNAKKLEYICGTSSSENKEKSKNKDYIIKEAESVISSYISKIDGSKKNKKTKIDIDKKYSRLKIYSIVISITLLIVFIKSIF